MDVVPKGTPVSVFTTDNLVFTDKTSDTALTLTNDSDYAISIKDPDNQTVTSNGSFEKSEHMKLQFQQKKQLTQPAKMVRLLM